MNKLKVTIIIIFMSIIAIMIYHEFFAWRPPFAREELRIGKNFTLTIPDDIVVDYKLIRAIGYRVSTSDLRLQFEWLDRNVIKQLALYMKSENLRIKPGNYLVNQAWYLDKVVEALEFEPME